jgi:cell wall-associated NlpC family hydrolase
VITEQETRAAIVAEAKEWLLTPWHHEARVKGGGVDCGMFLLEVYERCGLIPHIIPPHYAPDFMMHRGEEWFLDIMREYGDEITGTPKPGDAIIYRFGRLYCHGMIVIDYPLVIHAHRPEKHVAWGDVSLAPWTEKKCKIFRFKGFC